MATQGASAPPKAKRPSPSSPPSSSFPVKQLLLTILLGLAAVLYSNQDHHLIQKYTKKWSDLTSSYLQPAPVQYDTSKIWTTLLTNRAYLGGLLVLDKTLKEHRSKYQLVVMVTRPASEDVDFMKTFEVAGIPTRIVDKIEPAPRDGKVNKGTWEKLAPWSFTEYERVVMLDSDQVVLHNLDELMTMDLPDGHIAAAHACTCNPRKVPHYSKDWIPENCGFTAANKATGEPAPINDTVPKNHHLLNSGTVVLRPSQQEYDALIHAMNTDPTVPSMLFFDQDLLAVVYRNKWKPLPYIYNALKPMRSCHSDLWQDSKVKILHYILDKPWKSRKVEEDVIGSTHQIWWDAFSRLEKEWTESGDEKKKYYWEKVVLPQIAKA